MRAYYELHRDTELIAAQPDDEFYSITLPLLRVRYALVDPTRIVARAVPYYVPLGIVLTARELMSLQDLLPGYQERLGQWGLHSTEPVGTTILLNAPEELLDLIRALPQSDFYLPSDWTAVVQAAEPDHRVMRPSPGRVFLLSKSAQPSKLHASLPPRW